MSTSTPPSTPAPTAFKKFSRAPEREPGEQQHGFPFKPPRLLEAALTGTPVRRAAEGDDDLMSMDINATETKSPT